MDRGLIHKSSRLVGEIMGEGHGWWSVNNLRPPFEEQQHNPSLFLAASATTTSSSSSPLHSFSSLLLSNHYPLPTTSAAAAAAAPWQHDSSTGGLGQLQEPWSNLFIGRTSSGGLANAEEGIRHKSWEGHALIPSRTGAEADGNGIGSSSSSSSSSYIYSTAASHGRSGAGDEIRLAWGGAAGHHNHHHHHQQASSPRSSCITSTTSLGSNLLEFSNNASPRECISSTTSGVAFKKARTQEEPSQTTQSTVKVRKEKLGDRITALHQLVSPFGKTDTASVLLEAIGYIRFLHSQIEVLSSPYQPGGGNGGGGSSSNQQHEASVQQGERNNIFPEDPGQLLHDKTLRKRGHPDQDGGGEEAKTKDLRSRGLCLVPVSCTLDVGADAGPADYWAAAPPFGMGFGR